MLGSWTEYAGLWTNFLGIIWDIQNFLKICKSWVWVYALNNARYCISFSIYFCDITLYSYITPVFSRKKCLFINMLSEIHCKKIMNRKEPATKRRRKGIKETLEAWTREKHIMLGASRLLQDPILNPIRISIYRRYDLEFSLSLSLRLDSLKGIPLKDNKVSPIAW